jgi:uncharacterized membrane protein YkvA (DUF1232 family)
VWKRRYAKYGLKFFKKLYQASSILIDTKIYMFYGLYKCFWQIKLLKEDIMDKNKLLKKFEAKAKELKYNLSALYLVYKRKDVPIIAKIIIIITIAYALSPIDLIPDFIPILGYLDDLIILPFFIYVSLKLIPGEIIEECKEQAKDLWKDGKPKRWYYAIPVIAIYLLIIIIIVKNIFLKKSVNNNTVNILK